MLIENHFEHFRFALEQGFVDGAGQFAHHIHQADVQKETTAECQYVIGNGGQIADYDTENGAQIAGACGQKIVANRLLHCHSAGDQNGKVAQLFGGKQYYRIML